MPVHPFFAVEHNAGAGPRTCTTTSSEDKWRSRDPSPVRAFAQRVNTRDTDACPHRRSLFERLNKVDDRRLPPGSLAVACSSTERSPVWSSSCHPCRTLLARTSCGTERRRAGGLVLRIRKQNYSVTARGAPDAWGWLTAPQPRGLEVFTTARTGFALHLVDERTRERPVKPPCGRTSGWGEGMGVRWRAVRSALSFPAGGLVGVFHRMWADMP